MALVQDSANLPEGWFHTLPRLQQPQDSVSTAWHSTAFPEATEELANKLCQDQGPAPTTWAVHVGQGGNYCDQKYEDVGRSAQAKWEGFIKCFLSAQIPGKS